MKIITTKNMQKLPMNPSPGSMKNNSSEKAVLHCPVHGEYLGTSTFIDMIKRYMNSQCPKCFKEAMIKSQEREKIKLFEENLRNVRRLFGEANIPERFKSRTFENFRVDIKKQRKALSIAQSYARNFEERLKHGCNLVFAGNPGTGKTHLATAIANEILLEGYSVLFTSTLSATRRVKACYRQNTVQSEQEAIDALASPQLLILDEVGVQFGTETEKLILFEILNARYEAILPTIVISNLTEAELGNYLGLRILDRLQEGGSVSLSFDWESYRKKLNY